MNQELEKQRLDLLIKKAIYGLSEQEQAQLDEFERDEMNVQDQSFELTVAAIGLIDAEKDAAMPVGLRSKVLSDAHQWFDAREKPAQPVADREPAYAQAVPARSFWDWFGWAVAAAACAALVINIWMTRIQPTEVSREVTPTQTPVEKLDPVQQRQRLIDTSSDLVRASWKPGNVKELASVSGDIVWSDAKQVGYMEFTGLPANDKGKSTYQLWIFDETQDPKTPIDGGTFDIDENGKAVIPINAKLKAKNPKMFAVTIEKPGGVVVSKQEKVVAISKIET